MSAYLLLALAVLLTTAGNILLRLGMRRVGKVRVGQLGLVVRRAFAEPRLGAGIACLAGFFLCYSLSLTRLDVSLANPLTAVSILLASLFAALGMRERVTPQRWLGIALVLLGVLLVGLQ